jgi:cytochrome c-type biogenesis protein CcmF
MAELGYIALVLALAGSAFSIICFAFGDRIKTSWLNRNARNTVVAVFAATTGALVILLAAILTHHFEIKYVYQYTSLNLAPLYLFSALWAGNSGALLLWAWIISLCGFLLVLRQRPGKRDLLPYTLAVVMFTELFFLILVLFFANPFARLPAIPADGLGMNPLLENPGMLFHPPALLAGWALFVVPFGYAIAALLKNRLDNTWISASKRWSIMAWLLLGVGNLLGAWWAYAVLGWGGYWAWDPIENAGLVPWLLATAFIHSMVVQKRRGGFKLWNISLIVAIFLTVKLGGFLTRSDILSSVHTFGSTAMDPMFLVFIAISLFGSVGLIIWRRKSLKSDMVIEQLTSREATFFLSNLLFVGSAVVTLGGTLSPLLFGSITLKESFYNQAVVPIMAAIILMIGFCVTIGWRRPDFRTLRFTLLIATGIALTTVGGMLIAGFREWHVLVIVFICAFTITASFLVWLKDIRARKRALSESFLASSVNLVRSNRSRYGGYLVHISMAIIAIGVIGSSVYDSGTSAVLAPGDSVDFKGYEITYETLAAQGNNDKMEIKATTTVYKGNKPLGELNPAMVFPRSYEGTVARVAFRYSLVEDLYISLNGWEPVDEEDLTQGYWVNLGIEVNPVVTWIWIGGAVFLAGGLVCYWPRGKKQPAPDSED